MRPNIVLRGRSAQRFALVARRRLGSRLGGCRERAGAAQEAVEAPEICTARLLPSSGKQASSRSTRPVLGPLWRRTGCKVKVVEFRQRRCSRSHAGVPRRHRCVRRAERDSGVDPDLAQPVHWNTRSYVDKYGFRDELKKIAPTYRDNQMTVNGKIYGFPDDGDVFVLLPQGHFSRAPT